jgi:hypothetical protein
MRQLQQPQEELVAAPAYIRQPSAANGTGSVPLSGAAAVPAGGGKDVHVPVQQEQQSPSRKEAAAARHIKAHLSRPAVSRSLLHHLAKGFGVHLHGDVVTNEVTTGKYTIVTFLPVNLFEQFLRVANLYFLLMAILQLIPGLSPTSWFTTVAPLVFVLAVNAIKEGYDDVHRHRCVGTNLTQQPLGSSRCVAACTMAAYAGPRISQGLHLRAIPALCGINRQLVCASCSIALDAGCPASPCHAPCFLQERQPGQQP